MDDGGKAAHSCAGGQQPRAQQHRPFFYVQPPSQPYFLYQHWQPNHPYGHYGLPGGFNFGRPCVHPYQYMQYPGFVFPHAPIYPLDHRRMFEPRFYAPAWADTPRRQHQPQPHGRRETACSEAQTEPNDAISKLIECLDKIRVGELHSAERELDSGVASQTSGMFSPGEERKNEEQGDVLPAMPDSGRFETSSAAYGESATAVHDSESGKGGLEAQRSLVVPQGCWSGEIEDELPLDSSSLHEERSELELPAAATTADEHFTSVEKSEVMDIQADTSVTPTDVPKCGVEEFLRLVPPSLSSNPSALKDAKSTFKSLKAEDQGAEDNYQILKLPFESILTPEGDAAGHISPPAGPYYYNYLSMPAAHERMSVLSPSLDELSSRDEMFSTDLDDADLFPKHAYAGRRLVEVLSVSPKASEEVEEVWLRGSKRLVCACCGKSLAKVTGRSKVPRTYRDREPAADSEEDVQYAGGCERAVRVLVRKHPTPRKPHAVLPRPKPWHKRGPCKDPVDPGSQAEGRDLKQAALADGESAAMSGELQCRTCQDRLCRDDSETVSEHRWEDGDLILRRRLAAPPQRQEMSRQRKTMHHRPRDEEDEDEAPPLLHWDRGSSVRGDPRS